MWVDTIEWCVKQPPLHKYKFTCLAKRDLKFGSLLLVQQGHLLDSLQSSREWFQVDKEVLWLPDTDGFLLQLIHAYILCIINTILWGCLCVCERVSERKKRVPDREFHSYLTQDSWPWWTAPPVQSIIPRSHSEVVEGLEHVTELTTLVCLPIK